MQTSRSETEMLDVNGAHVCIAYGLLLRLDGLIDIDRDSLVTRVDHYADVCVIYRGQRWEFTKADFLHRLTDGLVSP